MSLKQFFAFLLVAVSSRDVWGDDARDTSIDGIWLPSQAVLAGKEFPDEVRKSIKLEIQGEKYTATVGTTLDRGTCKLDATARPKSIDITGAEGPNKGKTIPAIYERKGDWLRICYDLSGKARPTEFKSTEGSQLFLVDYKLQKP